MKTDVIFREEKDGTILAVFPYEVADMQGNVWCYAHVGQHDPCSYNYVLQDTRPAKDYSELYRELQEIGYDLNVIQRRDYDQYLASFYKLKRNLVCA